MALDCRHEINLLLSSRQRPGMPSGRPWVEVAEDLASLPGPCQDTLLAHVDRLLSQGFTDEGELLVSFFGACRADPGPRVGELLVRATESPRTIFKEEYAGLLDDWFEEGSGSRALASVVDAAAAGESRSDAAPALRALLASRSTAALQAARRLLDDEDKLVRDAAASYIYNLDDRAAAPDFLRRIVRETDPVTARLLADGLVAWGYGEARWQLEALSRSQSATPEMRQILSRAAADLAQG